MQIALFDLDHTLIPFDSGGAFARHMTERGVLDAGFEPEYQDYCRRYAAGRLDMREMHRYIVGAFSAHAPTELARWVDDFTEAIAADIPAAARALVRSHQQAGHACALVTATTRFIAAAFGRAVGLHEVLATEPELDVAGRYTGEIVGVPCFQQGKLTHVEAWLARQGRAWADVERSWFYSDSINDLPLLAHVSDPVAIDPDPALEAEARRRGWPVRSLREH